VRGLYKFSASAKASSARARKLRASNRISALSCCVLTADLTISRKFKNSDFGMFRRASSMQAGARATGLSATDAHWCLPVVVEGYVEAGESAMPIQRFVPWPPQTLPRMRHAPKAIRIFHHKTGAAVLRPLQDGDGMHAEDLMLCLNGPYEAIIHTLKARRAGTRRPKSFERATDHQGRPSRWP
jgi:hypothetical protein